MRAIKFINKFGTLFIMNLDVLDEMPEPIRQVYEKSLDLVGHKVELDLKSKDNIEGIVTDIDVGLINHKEPERSRLRYVMQTEDGLEKYDILHDVVDHRDMGKAYR